MDNEQPEDYYKILDVDKTADKSTIKKAYYKLAKVYHPDKVDDPNLKKEYSKKFSSITTAYEILSDDEKRKHYDLYGHSSNLNAGSNINPMDIFANLFGGNFGNMFNGFNGFGDFNQRRSKPIRKLKPIIHTINVSLADFYLGKIVKLAIIRKAIFKSDILITKDFDQTWDICTKCSGNGITTQITQPQPGYIQQTQIKCNSCEGSGYILKSDYQLLDHKQIIEIEIKKGMHSHTEITFPNMGDCYPGIYPGDIKIILLQSNESSNKFIRNGDNLYYNKDVLLSEALNGFEFLVKHLDDRVLCIKNTDCIISPNETKVIRGEGMPILNSDNFLNKENSKINKGDLIIKFNIVFPNKLTSKQKYNLIKNLPENEKCIYNPSEVSLIYIK